MLTQRVEPKPILRRKGMKIYPIYRNDDADDMQREFWYGTSPDCSDDGTDSFDIRDVPGYDGPTGAFRVGEKPSRPAIPFDPLAFLRQAIDAGVLQKHLRK
jgi:hypothetical protein